MNKQDFLDAIARKTIEVEIEGLGTVKIRSLSAYEVEKIQSKKLSDMQAALYLILYGLAEPALSEEDLKSLGDAGLEFLMPLANQISIISGIKEDPNHPN